MKLNANIDSLWVRQCCFRQSGIVRNWVCAQEALSITIIIIVCFIASLSVVPMEAVKGNINFG